MRTTISSLIVIAITGLLLLCGEGYARLFFDEDQQYSTVPPYWFAYHPFLGHVQVPDRVWPWTYLLNEGGSVDGVIKTNNHGFMTPYNFVEFEPYNKAPNEKVVLLTGGSAMMGVGVANNEQMAAYLLEDILNEKQHRYRYKVVNLANGGWRAYNQYIALDLFGTYLNPDWVITMDGTNDITTICYPHGRMGGIFYTRVTHQMGEIIEHLMQERANPQIYVSRFEALLTHHSTLYRWLFDRKHVEIVQKKESGWSDLEKATIFHLHAITAIVDKFQSPKLLVTLQPWIDITDKTLTDAKKELATVRARHMEKKCSELALSDYLPYMQAIMDRQLRNLVTQRTNDRSIHYMNIGSLLPQDKETRGKMFWDPVHLNGRGQQRLAEVFAQHILAQDSL